VRLLRALGAVARALPFETAGDLGAAVGATAFLLLGRRRRIAIENVTRALGPEPGGVKAEIVARRAFVQLGRTFVEFLALPAQAREGLLARIEFVGFEPLREWARAGRGAVVVTGHFGNWELLGMLASMGAPMKYLLPRQTNPGSDDYLNEIRRLAGVEPLTIGQGMRTGLRAIRSGAFLGMLPDQDARRAGIHVPFFGRPASTHTGPARLAIAANAPIAVGVIERTGRGRFRARVLRILTPDSSADRETEVRRLTAAMTGALEEAIRGRPDHWYWIHRRWKTPPPEEAVTVTLPAALTT
jgi:Kdo2-lipid IVA lauroyltransferase/acyltransferase